MSNLVDLQAKWSFLSHGFTTTSLHLRASWVLLFHHCQYQQPCRLWLWHEASLQSHLNPWKVSPWFQWELDQTLIGQKLPEALSYIPPMLPFPWYLQAFQLDCSPKSKMFIRVELHSQQTEEQMTRQGWCVSNTNDTGSAGCGHQLWGLGREGSSCVQGPQGTTG